MPNRGAGGVSYRYGFNGKETENDVKGIGNEQDYGMRIYDPRLGRFLSVDPLKKSYPGLTPYQFASNSVISGVDLDGLEFYYAPDGTLIARSNANNTQVRVLKAEYVEPAKKLVTENKIGVPTLNKWSTDIGISNEELNIRAFLTTIRYSESDRQFAIPYDAEFGMGRFKGKDIDKDGKISEQEKFCDHPRKRLRHGG